MENPTKTLKTDHLSIAENSNVVLTNREILVIGAREIEKANTPTYMPDLGVFNVIFRLMKSKGIITLNDTVQAGDSGVIDHPIPEQTDHPFVWRKKNKLAGEVFKFIADLAV